MQRLLLKNARGIWAGTGCAEIQQETIEGLVTRITGSDRAGLDVLCDLLTVYKNDPFAAKHGLLDEECSSLNYLAGEILRVIGGPAVDAILDHCHMRGHAIESGHRDPFASLLHEIGSDALPKTIAFLRQEEANLSRHNSEGCDFTQNSIDSALEALGHLGQRAITALLEGCARAYKQNFSGPAENYPSGQRKQAANSAFESELSFAVGVIKRLPLADPKAISTALHEKLAFLVNNLGLKKTVGLLEKFGSLAVPCLVSIFFDEHWRATFSPAMVRSLVVPALTAMRPSGSRVGLLYLDAVTLDPDGSFSPSEVGEAFQSLPIEHKGEAVALYNARYKDFLFRDLWSWGRVRRILEDSGVSEQLQLPHVGYAYLEELTWNLFSSMSADQKLDAVDKFSRKYHCCVPRAECAKLLYALLSENGLQTHMTHGNEIRNPKIPAIKLPLL